MADITPPIPADRQVIQSYGDGGFRISGVAFTGSVIVTPLVTVRWRVVDPENLVSSDILPLLQGADRVTVLLLGTGGRFVAVDAALRQDLRQAGIALEIMDTGAACRTYNVLMAEDRTVAAALIAV